MFLIASAFASAFTNHDASCVPIERISARMTFVIVNLALILNSVKQC